MRQRYQPRNFASPPVSPFTSAEEAWFWYVRSQCARLDGARFEPDMTLTHRPCDPDDLYRAVMGLKRARRLRADHLRVLGIYGLRDSPPDSRCREEEKPARLWDEALDQLTTVLKGKGIVA